LSEVQSFTADHPIDDVLEYYKKHQVVVIKKAVKDHQFGIKDISSVYAGDVDMLNETFSMETKKGEKGWGSHSSADLFGADKLQVGQWYASFIAQTKGSAKSDAVANSTYSTFKDSLPLSALPLKDTALKVKYTAPIWVFVGQNDQVNTFLHGRPEHIDSVNHDGTWHLQSSGTKVWYIRPADTKEWGNEPVHVKAPEGQPAKKRKGAVTNTEEESFNDGLGRLKVVVEKGDILIINTRVWWHQTRIPFTGASDHSISYAIDFFCKALRLTGEKELDQAKSGKMAKPSAALVESDEHSGSESGSDSDSDEEVQEYSNIDGIYSSRALKSGDVVFYESELPDCALPRSADPNCEIVWLEDGSGALFALKDLAVGDWLTVAPSDDEDSDDEDEDEEEEGESGEEGSGDDEECCEIGSGSEDEEGSGEEEN